MQVALLLCAQMALLGCLVPPSLGGRAFPIASENYVIDLFKQINPSIQWDYTNYLVDLSGIYAKCSEVGRKGTVQIDGVHPETQDSIGGLKDYTRGEMKHVKAVNDYLRQGLPSWITDSPYQEQIREATYFGCSVRPGCNGFAAFACMFTPAFGGNRPRPTTTLPPPTFPPWTRPPTRPTRPPITYPPPTYAPRTTTERGGQQVSLAFTKQQYSEAEALTGNTWDRSHYLENLSGYDIGCAMIDALYWQFPFAEKEAALLKMRVKGIYGSAPNRGSTPDAMNEILRSWPHIPTRKVGCSVIPDCVQQQAILSQLYVVVACIYEVP